jgi:malate synthase
MAGVDILGVSRPGYETILTPEAVAFVAHFARAYTPRVEELLARREQVQARYDAGEKPKFPPETRHVRQGGWKVLHYIFSQVTPRLFHFDDMDVNLF